MAEGTKTYIASLVMILCTMNGIWRLPTVAMIANGLIVNVSTFKKWQRNNDREHQMLTWLRCDKDKQDNSLVALLWCSACREYQSRIRSMKKHSSAWVTGSENQWTSNMLDHVSCDQHKAAMSHLRAAQAKARKEPVTSCALLMLDESEKGRMRRV